MIEPGTLTCYVKQNTITASSTTYAEEYKCPTAPALNIIRDFEIGENYSSAVGRLSPIEGQLTGEPPAPNKKKWVLSDVHLQEVDAGEHSILRLEFELVDANKETGVYLKDISLSWKQYSVSLLGFCYNIEDHNDKSVNQQNAPSEQKCVSEHIKAYISNPYRQQLSASSSNGIQSLAYQRDGSTVYKLNQRESAIAAKYNKGVEYAYYHIPVMNIVEESDLLSTSWESDCPFEDIAVNIDTITTLPYDAITLQSPIWSPKEKWQWVLVVDNVQCVFADDNKKIHRWKRTRQYDGHIEIDQNLYGNEKVGQIDGRWQIGAM